MRSLRLPTKALGLGGVTTHGYYLQFSLVYGYLS